jgi:hypothetical protein
MQLFLGCQRRRLREQLRNVRLKVGPSKIGAGGRDFLRLRALADETGDSRALACDLGWNPSVLGGHKPNPLSMNE